MGVSGRISVLYGSQTFTAQEIAERLWRTTKVLGFHGPVQAMDDYPIAKLIHEEFVLFVCATTGQGDEPDNMKRFWKFILRKNLPNNSLINLKFGVLGLGDSSYPKFNFVAKKLHKRLLQLGATSLLDIGLCDYQHDLGHDAVIIPWMKEFYTKLKLFYPKIQIDNLKTTFVPRWKVSILKDEKNKESIYNGNNIISDDIYFSNGQKSDFQEAIYLELEKNVQTTDNDHFQDVRLLKFKTVEDIKLMYSPGDILNLRPRNSKEDIKELFDIFHTHHMDIYPHYKLQFTKCHEGMTTIKNYKTGVNRRKRGNKTGTYKKGKRRKRDNRRKRKRRTVPNR